MGTFHVVGIDLQHGLRINSCRVRGAHIVVCLLRGGLSSPFPYEDTACKSAYSLVIDHVFVQLIRRAAGHLMVYQRVIIYMLLPIGNDGTVHSHVTTLPRQHDVNAVSGYAIGQSDAVMTHGSITISPQIQVAEASAAAVRLLHLIHIKVRIGLTVGLHDLQSEVLRSCRAFARRCLACVASLLCMGFRSNTSLLCMVNEEYRSLAALLHNDENAPHNHRVLSAAEDVFYAYRVLAHRPLGDIHHQCIVRQCGIERRQRVVAIGYLVVIGRDVNGCLADGTDIVHALDGVRRHRQPIVRGKSLCHIGVTVALHLARREAERLECLHRCLALRIQHGVTLPLQLRSDVVI